MKRVVEPGMVAHLWAHKSQDSAKNPGGNFYFYGDTIYSYGGHFPIAKHVENRKGEQAVLLTTRTYSSTTAGHISAVVSACSHLTVFHVANVTLDGAAEYRKQFTEYRERQLRLMTEYIKARQRKLRILRAIGALTDEANAFAAFFGLRQRLKLPADTEKMAEECERVGKAEVARVKRAETKAQRRRLEQLDKWVAGEYVYASFGGLPVRLRINGDVLQTSLGAHVPMKDAKRVYKILAKLRKRAKTYQRNGETIRLGPFDLDSMDETGTVKVGCHSVAWEEIQRIATLAGI